MKKLNLLRTFLVALSTNLILVLLPGSGICQIGSWTTLTNTNFIQDILCEGDILWVASTGGVFAYDLNEEEILSTLTNVEGMAHIIVTSIEIDPNEHLWFATDGGGISKFDRAENRWRTYGEFDGINLHVNTIKTDGKYLWIGSDEGLSLFEWGWDWEEKDTTYVWKENYDSRNGLLSDVVLSVAMDDTIIWVGTEGGGVSCAEKRSNLKDPQNWKSFTVDDGLPSNDIISFIILDEQVWVGTSRGVAVWNGQNWVQSGLFVCRVYAFVDVAGTIWSATSNGVYTFLENTWTAVSTTNLQTLDTRDIVLTDDGTIIVGTYGGNIAQFNENVWVMSPTQGPWRNNCIAVTIDESGFVWCSVRTEGYSGKINRYVDNQWTNFDEDDGLETGERIVRIMEDSQGRKWFASWGDGVSRLDSGIQGIPEDATFEVVADMSEDHLGNVWFTNYGVGVVVYSPQTDIWETFTSADGLVDRLTRSVETTSDGSVWIGVEQGGVSCLHTSGTPFTKTDDYWETFNADNGFTNSTVNTILIDENGTVWFGTSEGIFKYERNQFSRVTEIQNTGVLSLDHDGRGNLWVGTSEEGIYILTQSGDLQGLYNTSNSGLVADVINDVAFNRETGEIWIATPLGLNRYDSGYIKPAVKSEGVMSYPNPFILSGNSGPTVTFAPVPNDALVRIYSVSGEFVVGLEMGEITWDGYNTSGNLVGSGIYIVVVSGPEFNPRTGKLAVIR